MLAHSVCWRQAGARRWLRPIDHAAGLPRDGESFLFTSFTDRDHDIPLVNLGVLVVPDASSKPAFPISRGHIQNEATRGGDSIHQTFNHRGDVLQHMPECTHAPSTWTSALAKHNWLTAATVPPRTLLACQ